MPSFHENNDGLDVLCFEKQPEVLEPLPGVDDKQFKQENPKYFKAQRRLHKRSYVRTDKYSLESLYKLCSKLPEEHQLPPMRSAYE